jgi:hypothetical protein
MGVRRVHHGEGITFVGLQFGIPTNDLALGFLSVVPVVVAARGEAGTRIM